jgi:hypothetical protein
LQAVGPGIASLRLPRTCASPGSHRGARTHQQSVQTVRTNDTDTEGDGSLCAELGQSDSWYEGSVSSINVVLSPPKPAEKSSLGVKREEENVGDVKKRRHETADNDGGKSFLPSVSSITLVSVTDPRSLLSSTDLSSGSQNSGNISDVYVSNNSSEFSSSSREESLELKLQIGAIDNELVQSSNKKLSTRTKSVMKYQQSSLGESITFE